MGRNKKVEEGMGFNQEVQELDQMEAAPQQQNSNQDQGDSLIQSKKRGRKPNKKTNLNDLLAEFEAKKAKLVDRYSKKIHKLMGI